MFKELTESMRSISLYRLQLHQLTTQCECLRAFLCKTKDTLKALTLEHVSLDGGVDFLDILIEELSLNEVTLVCINSNGRALFLDDISRQRPICYELFIVDEE
jgi:hypothetical protein